MALVDLTITGSSDLTKLLSEAIELLSGRVYDRPGAAQRRMQKFREWVEEYLAEEPPARSRTVTFIWSRSTQRDSRGLTAQQRAARWFFAHYPNGYRRKSRLSKEWKFIYVVGVSGLTVTMRNEAEAASLVYGDIDRPQLVGHEQTGWYYAPDRLLEVGARFEEHIERETDLILEAAI